MRIHKIRSKIAIFLFVLAGVFFALPIQAQAGDMVRSGDYRYMELKDGNIVLYRYLGTDRVLNVPETVDGHTVTAIGSLFLMENDTVEEVVIPDTVTKIYQQAFMHKSNLKRIDLGNSIVTIEYQAFFRCGQLESIEIPDTCVSIGTNAFFKCDSLEEVHIPASVTKLGMSYNSVNPSNVFDGSKNLKKVTIDEDNPKYVCIDDVIYGKDDNGKPVDVIFSMPRKQESTYTVLDGVTRILTRGFEKMPFEKVILPDSVEEIGDGAFLECSSLKTVEGGNCLKRIGSGAFGECEALSFFKLPDTLEYVGDGAFRGVTLFTPLYPANLEKDENGDYVIDYSFSVKGDVDYEKAFACLELVNQERSRQGLSTLTMDQTLLNQAMQRAAECAVNFDHGRPNGTSCYSIQTDDGPIILGENISANQKTAEAVMSGWMESAVHKANILRSSYQSVGIGCVVHYGTTYWVQIFSEDEAFQNAVQLENEKDKDFFIRYSSYNDPLTLLVRPSSDIELSEGDTKIVRMHGINEGWTYMTFIMNGTDVSWKSSDTDVAKIDKNGTITAVGAGEAVITASFKGMYQGTVKVTVSHVWDSGEVTKPATYEQEGEMLYTCKGCKKTRTEIIEKLECVVHEGGKADCCHRAVCENCHEEYGRYDDRVHTGNTEIRNRIEPTCDAGGYSGDVYCLDCGKLAEYGTSLPRTEDHQWSEGIVKKMPTYEKEGERQYTCLLCGTTKSETIDKLSSDEDASGTDDSEGHIWNGKILKTVPKTAIHTSAEYKTIEHPDLYENVVKPEYKTVTIPAEPDSMEVYDIKYVWVEPEYKKITHKKGTTDTYLKYKKPVYKKKKVKGKKWTYKHAAIYKYKTEFEEQKDDYILSHILWCRCGKEFIDGDGLLQHCQDAEDAYAEAFCRTGGWGVPLDDEYWTGPYGNCSGGGDTYKYTQASTFIYKATKMITKKSWTETVYQSPSYIKYGKLVSGGLKNSKYVKKYNKKAWVEKRVVKDGYWKKVKYHKHKENIRANKAYETKVPTGKTKTTLDTEGGCLENAWTETIVTKESELKIIPAKETFVGTVCAECEAVKCFLCDKIFANRAEFDEHACMK